MTFQDMQSKSNMTFDKYNSKEAVQFKGSYQEHIPCFLSSSVSYIPSAVCLHFLKYTIALCVLLNSSLYIFPKLFIDLDTISNCNAISHITSNHFIVI